MNIDKFVKNLLFAINNNIIDKRLLSEDVKGFRGGYFFLLISLLNKVITYFNFKNKIIFTNQKPYIKINDLYFEIVNKYFLKIVNEEYVSKSNLTIKFLNKFKFKPKIIVDVGACWGEYSLILGRYFNESSIYAIEGSQKNYKILRNNITFELNKIKNVESYNYIVSDNNNFKFIKNIIATTNTVENDIIKNNKNYSKVKSVTLKKFLFENKLTHIDFLKLDIEGHELNLIKDILDIDIKFGQVEIINLNSLEENLKFLEQLSAKYKLYDSENFKIIEENKIKFYTSDKLESLVAFDVFIVSKKIKRI